MKKKRFVCFCAASLLTINCAAAPYVFAADYSFIQKMEPLLYDSEFQAELAAEKNVQEGEPDTRWFDPEDQRLEYEITTEEQLLGLAELVNRRQFRWGVNEVYTFEGITIKLMNDIELTQDWTPVGSSDRYAFEGIFDGNGHVISGLHIEAPGSEYQAFFGYLKGTVENLELQGTVATEKNFAAGLAAFVAQSAVVRDCTVDVQVTGRDKVGGIAGENSGMIANCRNLGSIKGNVKIGGIVGENWNGIVRECGNEGNVSATGQSIGPYGTGGIAGRSVAKNALIERCYNTGNISSENECTGGIAGYVGAQGSSINSCYNTGSVEGFDGPASGYAGGIAGGIGDYGVSLRNSYNAGFVKKGKYIGAILGSYTADPGHRIEANLSNNYYLDGSAPLAIGREQDVKGKRNYENSINVKSAGDLRSAHMASLLGPAYRVDASGMHSINNGYPMLKWQKSAAVSRDELLKQIDIAYQDEFRKFFTKYPYGSSSCSLFLKLFNPQFLFEEVSSILRDRDEVEKH